eukprot:UN09313
MIVFFDYFVFFFSLDASRCNPNWLVLDLELRQYVKYEHTES